MTTQKTSSILLENSAIRSHLNHSSMFDDNSDRKALLLLEEHIQKMQSKSKHQKENSTNCSPSSSKLKQSSISKFCVKSPSNERRSSVNSNVSSQSSSKELPNAGKKPRGKNNQKKKDNVDNKVSSGRITKRTKKSVSNNCNTSTLNRWLKKEKLPESCAEVKQESQTNNKKETNNKKQKEKKPEAKKDKKSFKRSSSGSFDKYGIRTPSVKEISDYKKKLEDQKRCIELFDGMEDSQESIEFNIEEPERPTIILDCKHLTEDEINEAFHKNYQYLHDIYHGVKHSIRHDQFTKGNCKDHSGLNYNTSMITFTIDQKHLLLAHLDKKFNKESCPNTTRYFFKVLLPELCTKIFMDVHDMTLDEANKYLENKPLQQNEL